MKKLFGRMYYVALMMVMFSVSAFAYLDPGTVTYVVSMIAGLFIAGGAAIAIFRRKIKLFFQNLGKKKETPAQTEAEADEFNPMEDVVDPLEGADKE